jgi:uncharacterized protein
MIKIRFEWDEAKNRANQRKHGISFERARQIFNDPLIVSIHNRHEDGEERWKTFGRIEGHVILVVVHTLREESDDGVDVEIIRIISARRADRSERRNYEYENG